MCTVNFKERVKNEAIINSKLYTENFINFEYLVCSKAFAKNYFVIKSDKGNYLHLIGIHTSLKPEEFFDLCMSGKLQETDFDFIKPNKSEKSVKGSVRQKITALPQMVNLFNEKLLAENNFKKNSVECAFATASNGCTLGFAVSGRPKSLLKGNELEKSKAKEVDLVFRKIRDSDSSFEELIFGNKDKIMEYENQIKCLISKDFFE